MGYNDTLLDKMGSVMDKSNFHGALLRLNRNAKGLVFPYMVEWAGAEYDTDNFFDPALPTQLTIPEGVSTVRLYAGIELTMGAKSLHSTFVNFRKNDKTFHGNPASNIRQGSGGWGKNIYTLVSPPLMVSVGDVFELRINNSESGKGLNKLLASPTSYMAIEVVGYKNHE